VHLPRPAPPKLVRVPEPQHLSSEPQRRAAPRRTVAPRKVAPRTPVRAWRGVRRPAVCAAATLAVLSLAGCAKIDAALGQQWIEVQFNPNTTIATARHVTQACSRIPNLPLVPIQPVSTDPGMAQTARYNATNASDANMSELQTCLQRFSSVQGFNLIQSGDS
jgi:hypothetical protein